MLTEMMFLQSFNLGGTLGNVLSQWEQIGVFSYGLPFLLIFALVFGILSNVNIFKGNKGINGIIALAVSLMALQFGFVSQFFAQIFPKLGIGLSVILAALILLGLFMNTSQTRMMFGIGAVVFMIIMASSFDFGTAGFWEFISQNIGITMFVLICLVAIFMVWRPWEITPPTQDNILSSLIRKAGQ